MHSEYVPEYVVETENGLLIVPEYSMALKRREKKNERPLQGQMKTYVTQEILLF